MNLNIAFSPCPNDTFIFYHLVHDQLSNKFNITPELHDVEKLNEFALNEIFDVTKLSFFAYFKVMDKYKLLNTGSALGKGCGPLLVKRKGAKLKSLKTSEILVPGLLTTANLLLNLYLERKFIPVPVRYDRIIPKLYQGEYKLGVIIHEDRFTYIENELELVADLGAYWENLTNLPIPLGAIAMKKSISQEIYEEFDTALKLSIKKAYQKPEESYHYITLHSQSMSTEVIDKHIGLYVNDYTKDLGEHGKKAIETLMEKSKQIGLFITD